MTYYNPTIEEVLRQYHAAALSSIYGPGSGPMPPLFQARPNVSPWTEPQRPNASDLLQAGVRDPQHFRHPPTALNLLASASQFAPQEPPSEKKITFLMEQAIPCFEVGGELRLCLPVLLHTVLRGYSLERIDTVCENLNIFCSRCTLKQLKVFKDLGILPETAPGCGLITKTNAERLANSLPLDYIRGVSNAGVKEGRTIRVVHRCFGKSRGIFHMKMYESAISKCIECEKCQLMFSPKAFVAHVHKKEETHVFHWGFDSDNWRAYLHLDSSEKETTVEEFIAVKEYYSWTKRGKKRTKPLDLEKYSKKPAVAVEEKPAVVAKVPNGHKPEESKPEERLTSTPAADLDSTFPPNVHATEATSPLMLCVDKTEDGEETASAHSLDTSESSLVIDVGTEDSPQKSFSQEEDKVKPMSSASSQSSYSGKKALLAAYLRKQSASEEEEEEAAATASEEQSPQATPANQSRKSEREALVNVILNGFSSMRKEFDSNEKKAAQAEEMRVAQNGGDPWKENLFKILDTCERSFTQYMIMVNTVDD